MEFFYAIFSSSMVISILLTTMLTKVIDLITPEGIKARWIVALVALVVVALNTAFDGSQLDYQKVGTQFLLTWCGAILFNIYLGQYTLDKAIEALKVFIAKKTSE